MYQLDRPRKAGNGPLPRSTLHLPETRLATPRSTRKLYKSDAGQWMFRTVLIFDQNNVLREQLAWMLRAQGYRVLDAGSVGEVLTILMTNQVDLLVLGLDGPGTDGRKVLASITNDPRHA